VSRLDEARSALNWIAENPGGVYAYIKTNGFTCTLAALETLDGCLIAQAVHAITGDKDIKVGVHTFAIDDHLEPMPEAISDFIIKVCQGHYPDLVKE